MNSINGRGGSAPAILGILGIIGTASFASYLYFNSLSANKSTSVVDGLFDFAQLFTGDKLSRSPKPDVEGISVFNSLLKPLAFEPKFVTIAKAGLKNVKIVQVGVEAGGRLEVPKSFDEVGWYVNGPKAGEDGNAILAGHFDKPTGAPAVFFYLSRLVKGDRVQIVDAEGLTHEFEVYEVGYVRLDDPTAVTQAYESSTEPILTIITCGGVWDPVAHNYNKRLLVKARRI